MKLTRIAVRDRMQVSLINTDMKNWKFTKFTGKYTRGDTKIGINKSGLIRLSSGFCRLTASNDYKYCLMFYDKDNKAIALKFVNAREDGVMKVTRDTTGATVSAKTFFKANSLDLGTYSGRYEWDKQLLPTLGYVFIIELNQK